MVKAQPIVGGAAPGLKVLGSIIRKLRIAMGGGQKAKLPHGPLHQLLPPRFSHVLIQ